MSLLANRFIPLRLIPLISTIVLFLILRSPPAWTLDIGTPGDARFTSGFSIAETSDNNETTFRWSMKQTRLVLHGFTSSNTALSMRLYGDERARQDDWHIHIETTPHKQPGADTQHPLARLNVAYGWRVYHVLLPQAATTQGLHPVSLALTSSTYRFSPTDHRDLGVPVDYVRLSPLARATPPLVPPLIRALFYGWLLAIVAELAWRLDHTIFPRSTRFAPLRTGPLVSIAAIALALWAWHNPYTLAWALPPTPWALGLATLILVLHSSSTTTHLASNNAPILSTQPPTTPPQHPFHPHRPLILALIFLIALLLRFYDITTLPYGLWRDEANHGLIALRILEDPSYRPIYAITPSVNMPALGLYPFALAIKLLGIHPWSMRPVTALAGALTVLPLYALTARLTGRTTIALLAAAFLATSSWHITISRFSFPTVFDPLLTLTALWLLLVGMQHSADRSETRQHNRVQWLSLLLAGVCLGLALQTYHTGRIVPVVAGVLLLLVLLHHRHAWQRWLKGTLVIGAGFLLITAPLLIYAFQHPSAFNNRMSGVFLLSDEALQGHAPLAVLDDSLGKHTLMFNLRGDSNGRHHAPGHPMLDIVTGVGFLAGCVVLLRHLRTWQALFVLLALALSLLPSLLAVEGPHAMRSIGAASFACIIAATGWVALIHRLANNALPVLHQRRPRYTAFVTLVLLALTLNTWTYFISMPTNPQVWLSFYPVHTRVGAYLRKQANTHGTQALEDIYVQSKLTHNAVLQYLTHNLPVQTFDKDEATTSHPASTDDLFIFSGYEDPQHIAAIAPQLGINPAPIMVGPPLPDTTTPSFRIYQHRHHSGKNARHIPPIQTFSERFTQKGSGERYPP
jgi:4-amino-4-deoxy-L-arabinose transferase-like glycosyltransferase